MKLGVSSYSFHQRVSKGLMSQLDVIPAAKEMGFDVIEFSTFTLPAGETPLTFAPRIREACDRANLPIANYTIGADFLNGCKGDWKAEAERLKDEVRVARILGAPGMRHDATRGYLAEHKGPRGFDDALPTLIRGCRAVTEFAADLGIKTMVENHGYFCQDSERVEKLANGVNHPNFGLLADMGNFMCADEDPARALGRVMPLAVHVHAKDFHLKPGSGPNPGQGWFRSRAGNYLRGSIIGHGVVPIAQCIGIMKRAGYDGVLSIEFEGLEDPLKGIAIGLENLRRFTAEAS
ncbi:MAG: sugar phosphate isomerase/epimerase family protein [Kiritimatiellia bacterium]|nr:sugar phosphate isomerase/epimerase family protein [Kiritimatiellia bacterium]